jgi:hypothetical protein
MDDQERIPEWFVTPERQDPLVAVNYNLFFFVEFEGIIS